MVGEIREGWLSSKELRIILQVYDGRVRKDCKVASGGIGYRYKSPFIKRA